MGMVDGLAAAEPVVLLNSKTSWPSPFFCAIAAFWTATKIAHLVRLGIQQIPRAVSQTASPTSLGRFTKLHDLPP
jgi:hypothetical protein